jgi:fumarate reductase subunit C
MMGDSHVYAAYHPRWLRRPVSTYWWLEKPSYFAFILREGSCMFVGWFVLYLLWLVGAVAESATAYQQFLAWSATPWVLLVNVLALAFLVFHAVTFFQAAPQAMVLHVGRRRVPGSLLLAGHYVAWVAASVVVYWVLGA